MLAETLIVERPSSSAAVLLAGLTTLAKSAPTHPVLPNVRLVRPDLRIEAAPLAEYRDLCGFDEAQGVPPIYPHLLAFPLHLRLMMRRDFPWPLAGTVHIANRIVQHRALAIGDRLTVAAEFGGFRSHPRGQAFAISAEAQSGGTRIWHSESMYLRRGARSAFGAPVAALSDSEAATTRTGAERIERAVAARYARLSGDRNPIHMSWLGARLFGFERPIAHGMWTKARALARVLPAGPVERLAIEVAFRAPILLPGRVTHFADPVADGTVFAVRDGAGERLHLVGRLGRDLVFEKGPNAQHQ
ncbi:MaoC/PaaZ C-terminal domain-containing protein [Sphingomonas sp. DG1-23]|uniref:MaoC/PaaZ C-terminal domain-containing protein n=1 Tax=Sphingomonas sp. DG1-23 TaxID=3068316 RepID=UPI00273EE2AE|nr:MaoC/PaaZ C-terminal domain-containing protein [Sphingomonas sp. DG1-23]MDP5280841.1 MaoC/PaaZ C-terminal domain-containing protein [Sphingomonas sp. DG1-23]